MISPAQQVRATLDAARPLYVLVDPLVGDPATPVFSIGEERNKFQNIEAEMLALDLLSPKPIANPNAISPSALKPMNWQSLNQL